MKVQQRLKTEQKMKHRTKQKINQVTAGHINKQFLVDYCMDRKDVFFLYFLTVFLYFFIGSLNHFENISSLFYAFLLSSFLWCCYGVIDCNRYLRKRGKIELANTHLEQAMALMAAGTLQDAAFQAKDRENSRLQGPKMAQLEYAYEELIQHLCEERSRMESEMEERRSDRNDYYLMWAHQIKTPIAAMKLLVNGKDEGFLLSEELFKIEQYVEMVLHYLRLESIASDMILKEYNLDQMVKQTIRKFSVLFINSGLTLELGSFEKVMILTDEKWFCFVLEQLLSNSIKYTKKGKIEIYLLDNASKILVVEDTGIGIRAEDLPRIFERGFTGYNGRMDKKSTGIGLYLCRRVMDQLAHGIRVESKAGYGTKVYLDLERKEE